MKNFPTSKHAEAGVTCVNCHLGFNLDDTRESPLTFETHTKPRTIILCPRLTLATNVMPIRCMPQAKQCCCGDQDRRDGGTPTPEPTAAATAVFPIANEPLPVSPLGFAVMAGLLGLAGGMVLAPWLERSYEHLHQGRQE